MKKATLKDLPFDVAFILFTHLKQPASQKQLEKLDFLIIRSYNMGGAGRKDFASDPSLLSFLSV